MPRTAILPRIIVFLYMEKHINSHTRTEHQMLR